MNKFAELRWTWEPAGPLVTGYSQNLAQAAGLLGRGARKVVNLQTRDATHRLRPSFLATSVKGVFRTAAAWLVERTARERGAETFVTCDYGRAVPERQRVRLGIRSQEGLCPVCQVFGGAGCLGEEVAPSQRQQGRVRFSFNRADDAWHGDVVSGPGTLFAWETVALKDVPFASEVAAVLGRMIELMEAEGDLTIRRKDVLEGADSHVVYGWLQGAMPEEDASVLEWAKVLADVFPYPELAKLAQELEDIAGCVGSEEEEGEEDPEIAAVRSAKKKIDKWLGRLERRSPKELTVEGIRPRSDLVLRAQVEQVNDFALALLLLVGDLVSSGFFRFGRFTTRGYGVVRLQPTETFVGGLDALLGGEELTLNPVEGTPSGWAVAKGLLGRDPREVVGERVVEWMG